MLKHDFYDISGLFWEYHRFTTFDSFEHLGLFYPGFDDIYDSFNRI